MQRFLLVTVMCLGFGRGMSAAEPEEVFMDSFSGGPADGWTWLREEPEAWRIRDEALEIRLLPGDANSVRNALVRPAPDRGRKAYAIEVALTSLAEPTEQYEQAGITWYRDGRPVFKLVKERVDGVLMIIPGRKPMAAESVQLRLIVDKDSFKAQYRPHGEGEYLTAATGSMPLPENDSVSLQGYHGPDQTEHWVRFDNFRILEIAE